MPEKSDYESPKVTVLGEVSDLTKKGGIYFDYPGAAEGNTKQPPSGAPGTTPSS